MPDCRFHKMKTSRPTVGVVDHNHLTEPVVSSGNLACGAILKQSLSCHLEAIPVLQPGNDIDSAAAARYLQR